MSAPEVGQKEVAAIFRVTTRTIQRWHDEGLPRHGEGPATTYRLNEVVAWAIERERSKGRSPGELDYDAELARKTAGQADKIEFELARLRGSLVTIDYMDSILERAFHVVRSKLLNLPGVLAPRVVGISSVAKAQTVVQEEIDRILEALADAGSEVGCEDDDDASEREESLA